MKHAPRPAPGCRRPATTQRPFWHVPALAPGPDPWRIACGSCSTRLRHAASCLRAGQFVFWLSRVHRTPARHGCPRSLLLLWLGTIALSGLLLGLDTVALGGLLLGHGGSACGELGVDHVVGVVARFSSRSFRRTSRGPSCGASPCRSS